MAITLKGSTAELYGLSTDSKPDSADLNTILHELDTGKLYYFDGTEWQEGVETSGGGSGGGSGDSDFVIINALFDDGDVTLDKTYSEIAEIIEGGKIPFINAGESIYMLMNYDSTSQVIRFGSAIMYGSGTTAYANNIYINGDGAYITYMDITVSAGGGE